MSTNAIKQELYGFIEKGDDKLVKMLYAVAKEYTEEDDYAFTEDDIREFEQRRISVLNGTSKTYSWEEAKKIITGK
jgi:hypothetical protein